LSRNITKQTMFYTLKLGRLLKIFKRDYGTEHRAGIRNPEIENSCCALKYFWLEMFCHHINFMYSTIVHEYWIENIKTYMFVGKSRNKLIHFHFRDFLIFRKKWRSYLVDLFLSLAILSYFQHWNVKMENDLCLQN